MNTDNPENQDRPSEESANQNAGPENSDSEISETSPSPPEEAAADSPGTDVLEQTAAETETEEVLVPESKPKTRSGGGFFAFLAFVMALLALSATGWMWWQGQQGINAAENQIITEIARLDSSDSELALKLKQVRDQVENLPSDDSSAEITALEQRLQRDVDELDRVTQSVNEQLAISRSLQLAGESLQRRLSAAETALTGFVSRDLDASDELDLAEVDYLLRLANERLKLFNDPLAADETLELADMHLAAMDDPVYLGVRQDIAIARRDLAALSLPDYFAVSTQLDSIQASIAEVPFKGQAAVSSEEAEPEEGWWAKVKSVFSGLVTVRRSTELENQRISLEDKDYVRQRLWLQLEISHLALMRRDQEAFQNSVARVKATLSGWFDENSQAFRSVMQDLESLETMVVQVDLPDISTPWNTLRQVRALRAMPVAAPVEQQPESAAPALEQPEEESASLPEDSQG